MLEIDLNEEFAALREIASCQLCKGNQKLIELVSCNHIVCDDCLGDKKWCVVCKVTFKPNERIENPLLKNVALQLAKIDEVLKNSNKNRYTFNVPKNCFDALEQKSITKPFKNKSITYTPEAVRNTKGETELHTASKKGNVNKIKELLENNFNPNEKDYAQWTPLHEAVDRDKIECAQILLEAGACPNAIGNNYVTPLHQAAQNDNLKMVKLLMKYGANPLYANNEREIASDLCESHAVKCALQSPPSKPENKQRYFVSHSNKNYYASTISKSCHNQLKSMDYTYSEQNVSLIVTGHSEKNGSVNFLHALAKGIMIISERKLDRFLANPYMDPSLVDKSIRDSFISSVTNNLECKPLLFDGMHFFVVKTHKRFVVNNITYFREDLMKIIEFAGGQNLTRAPTDHRVSSYEKSPFHAPEKIKRCAHFIVYDGANPPALQYKMNELKHVSAKWIIDAILNFKIDVKDF